MFPFAGQNIAANSVAGPGVTYENATKVIMSQTPGWFDEYKITTPDVIKAYHSTGDP